jgi:predicted DNA-binding transcriptional regulator AlpA
MLYMRDVMAKWKVSRPTLYRKIKEGVIPPPVDRYNNKSAWRKDQVEEAFEKAFSRFK